MKQSIYQQKERQKLKQKALELYKTGLTLREIGDVIDMSHEWVRTAVKDLSTDNLPTLDKEN